jgi:hypothetical protein
MEGLENLARELRDMKSLVGPPDPKKVKGIDNMLRDINGDLHMKLKDIKQEFPFYDTLQKRWAEIAMKSLQQQINELARIRTMWNDLIRPGPGVGPRP